MDPAGHHPAERRVEASAAGLLKVIGDTATIDHQLVKEKALIFRGFGVTQEELDPVMDELLPNRLAYVHGNSPRTKVGKNVYTSTEYPQEFTISMHNEMSYAHAWPARLLFFCQKAAETGGATPVTDSALWLQSLDPEVREAFKGGVCYQQNLHDGLGLGKSWQDTFETTDRAEVEAFLGDTGAQWEWKPDGSLRVRQIRPATAVHPVTGTEVWFDEFYERHPAGLGDDTAAALAQIMPGTAGPMWPPGIQVRMPVLAAARTPTCVARRSMVAGDRRGVDAARDRRTPAADCPTPCGPAPPLRRTSRACAGSAVRTTSTSRARSRGRERPLRCEDPAYGVERRALRRGVQAGPGQPADDGVRRTQSALGEQPQRGRLVVQDARAREQHGGGHQEAAPRHRAAVDGGLPQRRRRAGPARAEGRHDDAAQGHRQAGPEGDVERPGLLTDPEPGRGEALSRHPRGEPRRGPPAQPAPRARCEHPDHQGLRVDHAPHLTGCRARHPQESELPPALRHREGERRGDHEHRHERGDAGRRAEQGVHRDQGLLVAVRVGVGAPPVVAGEDGHARAGAERRADGGRVGVHRHPVDARGQARGLGGGEEHRRLEAGRRHRADHGAGAGALGRDDLDPVPGAHLRAGPGRDDDLAGRRGGASGGEAVRRGRGDGPRVAHERGVRADPPVRVRHRDRERTVLGDGAHRGQLGGQLLRHRTGVGQRRRPHTDRGVRLHLVRALHHDPRLGEPFGAPLRRVERRREREARGGDEADPERERDERTDERDPAGAHPAQRETQHDATADAFDGMALRAVIRWATCSAVGVYSSPWTVPSARKSTRSA
ncbi:hypothetical protein SVIOM74S_07085 [Streptomyces violarus]